MLRFVYDQWWLLKGQTMKWRCEECMDKYHIGGVCVIDVPGMDDDCDGPLYCPWSNEGPYKAEWEPVEDHLVM